MGALAVQAFVSFFLSVNIFMVGFTNVWPSYALKMLEADDSPLGYKITQSEGSLIGSVPMLGAVTAVSIGGYMNERIGRKKSAILCGLFLGLAWSIIATAKSVIQLSIGRFLAGFGGGAHLVIGLVFITEISQPSIRGTLISTVSFQYCFGTLASYLEGWFCSYAVINYISVTITVAYVVFGSMILKESPVYLLKNGYEKEALKSLQFYRGSKVATQEILHELSYLRSQLNTTDNDLEKEKLNLEKDVYEPEQTILKESAWNNLLTSKSNQRSLVLLVILMMLTVFMGQIGVQAYAGQFFLRAAPGISPDLCSVILALLVTIISAVTIVITDMIPRRILMMTSCGLTGLCLGLAATMLRWSWAPDLCVPIATFMSCIFYNIGTLNIPFIQIGETIAPQVRSLASSIISSFMFISNFLVLYTFEPTVDILGLDGVFFLFTFISIVTTVVSYFFMRETRNVPYEVVKDMFEDGYLCTR